MNQPLKSIKNQLGLTLVELLVAMVIGVFLVGGISQTFIGVKRTNNLLIAQTSLQENARFAFSFITRVVEKSAGLGCVAPSDTNTTSLLNFTDATFRPWIGIEGWEADNTKYGSVYSSKNELGLKTTNHWTGPNGTALDENMESVENSDILSVWYTADRSGALTSVAADELNFTETNIEKGDIVVLNDCKSVTFAQACECDDSDAVACSDTDQKVEISPSACSTPGNNTFDPSDINLDTANLHVLKRAVFSVGRRSANSSVTSLFLQNLGSDGTLGDRYELLEGLESIQIRYGEDTNNDKSPNYYVNADEVADWQNVVSIRLSLLMRSLKDNLINDPQNIIFNGASVAVNDRYLRGAYETTISLRNRNIGY